MFINDLYLKALNEKNAARNGLTIKRTILDTSLNNRADKRDIGSEIDYSDAKSAIHSIGKRRRKLNSTVRLT